jgi:hypothetical protein
MGTKKTYDKTNRWSAKYRKDVKLWVPTYKRNYLYWYKFLQLAEKDPNRKVDWRKYKLWGGKKVVMETKFDDWWQIYWIDCFGIENEGDTPKCPLTSKKPNSDTFRYALRLYENRHRGSNWEIALWFRKTETRTCAYQFFWGADENMKTKTRLTGDGRRRQVYDEWGKDELKWIKNDTSNKFYGDHTKEELDANPYQRTILENAKLKREVQSRVGRYLKNAEKYLDSVCEGKFP